MRKFNDQYSLVRMFHAVPEGDAVDVYVDGSPFFRNLNFTEFSPYIYIPEGTYEIAVYLADTVENPLVMHDIELDAGTLVTIAVNGNLNDIELLKIEEDMDDATGNNSKVRAVHLAPSSPEINVIADGQMLFRNVEFRDVTDYKEVAPKVYDVDIETSQGNRLIRSNQVTINPNRVYTFYAVGNIPNVQIIQSLDGATFMEQS
ncbi:DUF4397 domain-containing protein [Romboutsia weinsteinii]|nr:DUF4397 domain-containing protein [Romboutsia weinsteinii]